MADIKQAFLQIDAKESDRDLLRFFWLSSSPENYTVKEFDIFRMCRAMFGASSSPFLLAATIRFHLKKYEKEFPQVCQMLDEMLYVDDLIAGSYNSHEAFENSNVAKSILSSANFHLIKWLTNDNDYYQKWIQTFLNVDHLSTKP